MKRVYLADHYDWMLSTFVNVMLWFVLSAFDNEAVAIVTNITEDKKADW